MAIRIVIADDHPLILDGMQQLFALEPDLQVVARCAGGQEAVAVTRRLRPDILLLDVKMPGLHGLDVIRALSSEQLPTRIVLVTAGIDDHEVLEAIRLGVRGIVLKEMAPRLLVQCVRKVHAGETWLEKESVGRALEMLLRRDSPARDMRQKLTRRELEIVRMVADGLRNRDIAERLAVSEGTVKMHLHNIFDKLDIESRVELALQARDHHLV